MKVAAFADRNIQLLSNLKTTIVYADENYHVVV